MRVSEEVRHITTWLQGPDRDGLLRIEGHADGSIYRVARGNQLIRGSYLISVIVPEEVNGIRLYHAIPLLIDQKTDVLLCGRSASVERLVRDGLLEDGVELVARFAVTETGVLRAHTLEIPDGEWEWNSSQDMLPNMPNAQAIYEADALGPRNTGFWLDIPGSAGDVVVIRGQVVFAVEGTISEPPHSSGIVDVAFVDYIGPAPFFHIAQAFVADGTTMSLITHDLMMTEGPLSVQWDGSQLWLVEAPAKPES